MKKIRVSLALLLSLFMVAFISCKDDDDGTDTPLVEDGVYIVGDATNFPTLDSKGLMKSAANEASSNAARDGFYELYTTIEAGKSFYISEVTGKSVTNYGPSSVATEFFSYNPDYKGEQSRVTLQWGKIIQGTTTFTVPTSGLYHIIFDKQLSKVAIVPVEYWAIIGGATPKGWSDNKMEIDGAFNKSTMTYKITDLVLRKGDFKFRYSGGWKLNMDDTSTVAGVSTVKVNTNLGGSVSAPIAGGSNIAFAETDEGKYTVEIKWTLESGYAITMSKTGTVDPLPTYPDSMYVAGAAVAWGWNPGAQYSEMHKIAGGTSNDGVYWKICYLAAGQGFKIAGKNWGEPNLDYGKVTTWDPNGITVTADGSNWTVATSGLYMLVLDLRTKDQYKVSIMAPEVYGMDAPFNNPNWTSRFAAAKFTVDNTAKNIVSPTIAANGSLRSYVYHPWITDWWHAEFVASDGKIIYRNNGGDLAAVSLTAGQVITYHFDDNTGTIAK